VRVLVVTNMYPPHHYGGYEVTCAEFVAHLERIGHEPEVLTSDIEVPGVTTGDEPHVTRALRLYWRDHVVLEPGPRGALRIERANRAAVLDALDRTRPDVVSVWNLGCVSLDVLRVLAEHRIPTVHVVSDDWPVYAPLVDGWLRWGRRLGPARRVVERVTGAACRPPELGDHGSFCFISDATRLAAATRWSLPRAGVGYCGFNEQLFPLAGQAPRDGWSWRLLHVGRIDERKGIHVAIDALAHLPEVAVLHVDGWGDDETLRSLRDRAARAGVAERVRFQVTPREQLASVYATADIVLFPTLWSEPFGLVPLEAMACSTPVVATGTGGSGEYLLDGVNCLRVPPGDPAALAAAARALAGDGDLRRRLVEGGWTTAGELTLGRWLELLEAWHRGEAEGAGVAPTRPPVADVLRARLGLAG